MRNKKGFAHLFVVLLIIVIVGVLVLIAPQPYYQEPTCPTPVSCQFRGWKWKPSILNQFLTKGGQQNEEVPFNGGMNDIVPLSEKEVVGEKINDWKTYRNEEYGFEFMYSPTEGVQFRSCGSTPHDFNGEKIVVKVEKGLSRELCFPPEGSSISISVLDGNVVEGAYFSSSGENYLQEVSIEQITIAGIQGKKYVVEITEEVLGSLSFTEARVYYQNKTYAMYAATPDNETILNQILSTFEFLD